MKILYIHQYFYTPSEPGGTRSYWFSRELVSRGHEVTMLTSSHRGNASKLIERKVVDGINVIYVKNPYSNDMNIVSRLWSFLRFMFISTFIGLRQTNIDLVYATSTPLSVGIPALLIKWIRGVNFVFEVRDLWPEFPIQMGAIKNKIIIKILRLFEKKIYEEAIHVVALSPGMKDGVINSGINESKVTLIPNMSKKDEFFQRPKNASIAKSFNLDLKKFHAIHFGTMGIANGLGYIIDAAVYLKKQGIGNIDFVFMGGGRNEKELKKACGENGLTNVKFLGKHRMDIVSEIVNICDCSIVTFADIPILYTNSPNKLFDSLSAGKPIIVNSSGWTKDMVEDNQCGVFVNPAKPEELANVLVKMSQSPGWLTEMSKNSRQLAENVYDKSILCHKFIHVIEKYDTWKAAHLTLTTNI